MGTSRRQPSDLPGLLPPHAFELRQSDPDGSELVPSLTAEANQGLLQGSRAPPSPGQLGRVLTLHLPCLGMLSQGTWDPGVWATGLTPAHGPAAVLKNLVFWLKTL